MKSKGGPVEEGIDKKTSQYSKFEFFLPKTESYDQSIASTKTKYIKLNTKT